MPGVADDVEFQAFNAGTVQRISRPFEQDAVAL
jgi:hypothetical protein